MYVYEDHYYCHWTKYTQSEYKWVLWQSNLNHSLLIEWQVLTQSSYQRLFFMRESTILRSSLIWGLRGRVVLGGVSILGSLWNSELWAALIAHLWLTKVLAAVNWSCAYNFAGYSTRFNKNKISYLVLWRISQACFSRGFASSLTLSSRFGISARAYLTKKFNNW